MKETTTERAAARTADHLSTPEVGRDCPLAGGTATIAPQGTKSAPCPGPARQERVRSPPAGMVAGGAPLIGRGWCQVVQWESCARSTRTFTHRAVPAA